MDERAPATTPSPAAEARPRLTARRFLTDLADEVFSLDRGLPWTFAMLFRDPRAVVRGYIGGLDFRATRPLRYFLVVAIGITLLGQALEQQPRRPASEVIAAAEARRAAAAEPERNVVRRDSREAGFALGVRLSVWTIHYTDRMLLALMPFLAAGLFAAFARQGFNFAEHWVVAMYAVAQLYLVGGSVARLAPVAEPVTLVATGLALGALYFWICASVYDGRVLAKLARAAYALLVAVLLLFAALVTCALVALSLGTA